MIDIDNDDNQQATLVEILRRCITNCGMTINAIARATGIKEPSLHWFVHRERELAIGTVQKLVDFFDLQLQLREEEVARQCDADFVPANKQEVLALHYQDYYDRMTALEHEKREMARQARTVEPSMRQSGHIKQADALRRLAAHAEQHAAQLRAYIETRLEPERKKVLKILAKAKERAKEEGRDRRSNRKAAARN
jgi:hypothetical protein